MVLEISIRETKKIILSLILVGIQTSNKLKYIHNQMNEIKQLIDTLDGLPVPELAKKSITSNDYL